MCGIVACSGVKESQDVVVDGLSRMQYRGYDSYGFAYVTPDGRLDACRSIDEFDSALISLPVSQVLLGHTRWATHGAVNLQNSHPHLDPGGQFALVHNGIVDNFASLKETLLAEGVRFETTTDTEVLVHLMSKAIESVVDRLQALMLLQTLIKGRNTCLFLFPDGELLGIRQGSPLVVSQGHDGERNSGIYIASDVLAFADQTCRSVPLLDGQIVSVKDQVLTIFDDNGVSVNPDWVTTAEFSEELNSAASELEQSGYKHFMFKEILEQWRTIPAQCALDEPEFEVFTDCIRQSGLVLVTGAGGAFYAAKQVAWLLRTIAGIKAMDVAAYEIQSLRSLVTKNDLLLVVSQSGETADSLQAIQTARDWGMKIACLVNMRMSTMTRISDFVFYNRAGAEECVLSTKSATAQITFGYLLANNLINRMPDARRHIDGLSRLLSGELVPSQLGQFQEVAKYLTNFEHLFVLGRGEHFANALIGALNIKEASYLHAEAFSAGELKHGVIALLEPGTPVILFMPKDDEYMLGVANEVKARGAYVIAITNEAPGSGIDTVVDVRLPLVGGGSPLSAIIACQLLAYYIAVGKDLNPDRPRNLAKSVTVQ